MGSLRPEDRERALSAAMNQARAGVDRIEHRIIRPDGSLRGVHGRSYPLRNPKGNIHRLGGGVEEITDRQGA